MDGSFSMIIVSSLRTHCFRDILRRHQLLIDHPATISLRNIPKFPLPDILEDGDDGRMVGRKLRSNSFQLLGRKTEVAAPWPS